jgi:hypothetical protein
MIKKYFPGLFQACVLMNNVQQTRVQLEKTYHAMGGKDLEENTADILNKLQSRLSSEILDEMAKIFVTRLFLTKTLHPFFGEGSSCSKRPH